MTPDRILDEALRAGRTSLDEHESLCVLQACAIPTVQRVLLDAQADESRVRHAASELGHPLVLKGVVREVRHKTERRLVHLGLDDEEAVLRAVHSLREEHGDSLEHLLLQHQLGGCREMACGVVRDPSFGPTVMVGFGGLHAEAVLDRRFLVAPLTEQEALTALAKLRTSKMLGAYRGEGQVALDALARVLVALGDLARTHHEIREVDVNPVMFHHDGTPVAVDALVILDVAT